MPFGFLKSAGNLLKDSFPDIVAGGLGLYGGHAGNVASAKQARLARQFSAEQAQVDRMFQRKQANQAMRFSRLMSDTAHQRNVRDLRRAGLNPILSARYGGASSPQGVSAKGAMPSTAMAQQKDIVSPAVSAYMAARENRAHVRLVENQAETAKADAELKNAQRKQANELGDKYREETWLLELKRRDLHPKNVEKILAETQNIRQRLKLLQEETKISAQQLKHLLSKFPHLKNEERVSRDEFGQIMSYIHRVFSKPNPATVGRAVLGR